MATFYLNHESELYHHGILGMHWGIRRYQNKDGSLTQAGRMRYDSNGKRISKRKMEKQIEYNKSMGDKFAEDVKSQLGGHWSVYWSDDGVKDGVSRTIEGENITQYKKKDGSYSEAYTVTVKSDTDSKTAAGHAEHFKQMEKKSHADAQTARNLAANLYELYNDMWRQDGKPKLTKNEFVNKLSLEGMVYHYDDDFPEVFFHDNGLFGWNGVHVYKNKDGFQYSVAG